MTVRYLACLALGYLIGSLSVSILISKYIFHQDVRTLGSGNAGAANAARTLGPRVGALTLLGDLLTGSSSMLLGSWLGGTTGLAIAGAACMIGHCFPIYFGFKGGKAVATAVAVALMLDWRVFLSAFAVFAVVAALTRTASVSSMAASIAVAAMTPVFTKNPVLISLGIFTCLLVLLMHRSNIRRLIQGTEPKFHFGKHPEKEYLKSSPYSGPRKPLRQLYGELFAGVSERARRGRC